MNIFPYDIDSNSSKGEGSPPRRNADETDQYDRKPTIDQGSEYPSKAIRIADLLLDSLE